VQLSYVPHKYIDIVAGRPRYRLLCGIMTFCEARR
jgi:hypothetical protein